MYQYSSAFDLPLLHSAPANADKHARAIDQGISQWACFCTVLNNHAMRELAYERAV